MIWTILAALLAVSVGVQTGILLVLVWLIITVSRPRAEPAREPEQTEPSKPDPIDEGVQALMSYAAQSGIYPDVDSRSREEADDGN